MSEEYTGGYIGKVDKEKLKRVANEAMNHQLRLIERMKFDFSLLEDERGIIDAIISHERKTGVEVKKFCWTDGFPGAIEGIVGDTIGIHSDLDRVLVKFMKDDLKLEETNWEVFK